MSLPMRYLSDDVVNRYLHLLRLVEPEWAAAWLLTVLDSWEAQQLQRIVQRATEIDAGSPAWSSDHG